MPFRWSHSWVFRGSGTGVFAPNPTLLHSPGSSPLTYVVGFGFLSHTDSARLVLLFFLFFFLLGPPLQHMEVPRLGVELELQLPAYTTATAYEIWVASVTHTAAHGNAGSLAHWAGPGIEPASSWILVRFLTHWATMGTGIITLTLQKRKVWLKE